MHAFPTLQTIGNFSDNAENSRSSFEMQPGASFDVFYPIRVPTLTDSLSDWFSRDPYFYNSQSNPSCSADCSTSTSAPKIARDQYGNCVVCGLQANGVHYGRRTCEACKSFFKRAVQTHAAAHLVCKNDGKCVIISGQRSYCRRCRWDKCVDAGLQEDAVRRGIMAGRAGRPTRKPQQTP